MEIGEYIKQTRREQGLSQAQLGELLGISASAVGMYEQNRRVPDAKVLDALCRVLRVEPKRLLWGVPKTDTCTPEPEIYTLEKWVQTLENFPQLRYQGRVLTREEKERIARAIQIAIKVTTAEFL